MERSGDILEGLVDAASQAALHVWAESVLEGSHPLPLVYSSLLHANKRKRYYSRAL